MLVVTPKLSLKSAMTECVIFDCDGTLVDSEYLCNLALEMQLRELGIESEAGAMLLKFRGLKLSRIVQQLEFEHKTSFADDFIPSYRLVVDRLFEEHLEPCPGVVDMLEAIDLPVCVASSGPLEKIRRALSLTGLAPYFGDKLFSSYSIKSWKPEPGIFIHAAAQMGFSTDRCVVVEDSLVGIEAALSAGAKAVQYDPDMPGNSLNEAATPVLRISHMTQLQGLLKKLDS